MNACTEIGCPFHDVRQGGKRDRCSEPECVFASDVLTPTKKEVNKEDKNQA